LAVGSPGAGDLAFVLVLGDIVALVAAHRRRRGCRTSLAWLEVRNHEGKGCWGLTRAAVRWRWCVAGMVYQFAVS